MSRVRHQNIEINKVTTLNNTSQIYFHCTSAKSQSHFYFLFKKFLSWTAFLLKIFNDLFQPMVDTTQEQIISLIERFPNSPKEILQYKAPGS